jgi:hypothetical protein
VEGVHGVKLPLAGVPPRTRIRRTVVLLWPTTANSFSKTYIELHVYESDRVPCTRLPHRASVLALLNVPNRIKSLLHRAFFDKRLNKWAVRLYALFRPPPHRRPNMEFEFDVWNGISTFYASTGRQIGESNTGPAFHREVTETEQKITKFADSRYGRHINVTALRYVIPVWDDVLQFTTLLRNHFIQRHGVSSGGMNPRQSYVFSKMGAGYVAFLARRRRHPLKNGTLTPTLTGFFTLAVGPFMVVRALMEMGDLTALEESTFSAEAWYALADRSGSLLAGINRACAGTKKMITEFVDVAINGSYDKPLTSVEADRAFACVDDWGAFYQYLYASSRLELLIKLNQALTAQALIALQSVKDSLGEDERRMIQDGLAHCFHSVESAFDDRTTLTHFTAIALALLDELKYPAVASSLSQAGVLDAGGAFEVPLGDTGAAVRRIRVVTSLIYPYCSAELASLHASLGRAPVDPISLEDLYARVAGVGLKPLLASLERASMAQVDLAMNLSGQSH